MAESDRLFGTYQPRGTWVERVSVGVKYLAFLVLTLPAFLVRQWWLTAALLIVVVALVAAARLGARRGLGLPRGLVVLFVALAAFQALTASWVAGLVLVGNLLLAVWASRLIVMTTPVAALLDALAALARPACVFGGDPERFALAVAIMLRSVPHLAGEFTAIRQAAKARGVERRLFGQLTQVIVKAVAYGKATGEALDARGLAS